MEPLDIHRLGLTIDRLTRATRGSDGQLVAPAGLRTHLLAASRDEPNAGVGQQTGGICGANAILVADEPGAGRQGDGHLVERRQVVSGRCRGAALLRPSLTRAPLGAQMRCERKPNNRLSFAA